MIERGRAVKAGATAGCFQAIVSLIPEHLFKKKIKIKKRNQKFKIELKF